MKYFLIVLLTVLMSCISYSVQANSAHERLVKLSDSDRQNLLTKVLSASGEKCTRVNKTFFQGKDANNNAYWNVVCTNDISYSITVNNDARGSTKILDCKVLKLAGVNCFKKF